MWVVDVPILFQPRFVCSADLFWKKSQALDFVDIAEISRWTWQLGNCSTFSTLAALEFHSTRAALSSPSLLLRWIDSISFSTRKPYTLVNNAFGSRHFWSWVERYNQSILNHCNFHLFAGTELWCRPLKLDPLAPFCGKSCTSTVSGIGNEGLKTFKDVTGTAFPIVSSYFASNDACKTSLQVRLY